MSAISDRVSFEAFLAELNGMLISPSAASQNLPIVEKNSRVGMDDIGHAIATVTFFDCQGISTWQDIYSQTISSLSSGFEGFGIRKGDFFAFWGGIHDPTRTNGDRPEGFVAADGEVLGLTEGDICCSCDGEAS
jgi:hypothetical protein